MPPSAPSALLLISTGCAHCQQVLAALVDLAKRGLIGRLEIINVAVSAPPEAIGEVRSVPWVRIGPFELAGARSADELGAWAARIEEPAAFADYLTEQLENGELATATAACRRHDTLRPALLRTLGDLETPFAVRIGATAVVEELAHDPAWFGDPATRAALFALADSPHPQVRADAAHLIGLVDADDAMTTLRRLLEDDDPSVREIAAESIAERTAAD